MPSERLYAIRLTAQAIGVVSQGLEGLPYRIAAPVIDDITRQVNAPSPCQSCQHASATGAGMACASEVLQHLPRLTSASAPAEAMQSGACALFEPKA